MDRKIFLLLLIQSFYVYNIYAQTFCRNTVCSPTSPRIIDGTCNNIDSPWIGSANTPFQRLLPPMYDDNSGSIKRRAKSGKPLPTPRDVSLNVHAPREGNGTLSLVCVLFGQFITHDCTSAASQRDSIGNSVACSQDPNNQNPVCINVKTISRDTVNQDQPFFEISRTAATSLDFRCNSTIRDQLNAVSGWPDLSIMYGSRSDIANSVRSFGNGFLLTSTISGLSTNRQFLPKQQAGGCFEESSLNTCFRSGEFRPNENLVINGLQVLFLREHNRIAGIAQQRRGFGANDETLFQDARRILNGIYHHIIYSQWLPVIIGKDLMDKNGLTVSDANSVPDSFKSPYDKNVLAQVYNEFAGACFRFGHSLIQSNYSKKDKNYKTIKVVDFGKISFNPSEAYKDEGIDGFIRGALTDAGSFHDSHITNIPENHLFEDNTSTIKRGSLSTLSIQRGRDHAFQPYLKYRQLCGLSVATSFDNLGDMSSDAIKALRDTYESVDDIELYSGGLSENPVPGGVVGPTFACVIARQFKDWKIGDRFFYENDFNVTELREIKKATLNRMICDNVDVSSVPQNPFLPVNDISNPLVSCSSFPSIDITKLIPQSSGLANAFNFFTFLDFFKNFGGLVGRK